MIATELSISAWVFDGSADDGFERAVEKQRTQVGEVVVGHRFHLSSMYVGT